MSLADSPAHALDAYPGRDGTVQYKEGLLVGYRYFDTKKIEPLFPFGYGLSYTRFNYSNLHLDKKTRSAGSLINVEFDLANAGDRRGGEVAQVYVHQIHSSLPRPDQELKGFKKIFLNPGEKKVISIPLDIAAFSYYDPNQGGWMAEKGNFEIRVGSSSRDIRCAGRFTLEQTTLNKARFAVP